MPHPKWCTALTEEQRECMRPQMPGAPLSLCQTHMIMAAVYIRDIQDLFAQKVIPEPKPEPKPKYRPGELRRYTALHAVYYIRFGERVKIGVTTDFPQRMQALPHDEILALEPGDYDVERARHRQFSTSRVTGEWFDPSPALVTHIRGLRAKYGNPVIAWDKWLAARDTPKSIPVDNRVQGVG